MYLFEDSSGLRTLTGAKVAPYGRAVDNTLLRHVMCNDEPSESVARGRSPHGLNFYGQGSYRYSCTLPWLIFFASEIAEKK